MKNILIAEDDNNFGMMLTVFLEMNDFKVTLAQNGEEALQKIKHQKFDLCILDIMMPLLDGFTVAETIKIILRNSLCVLKCKSPQRRPC